VRNMDVLQCDSVLQWVAVCCSALQCVAWMDVSMHVCICCTFVRMYLYVACEGHEWMYVCMHVYVRVHVCVFAVREQEMNSYM